MNTRYFLSAVTLSATCLIFSAPTSADITYFVQSGTGTSCDLSVEDDQTKSFDRIQGAFDCLKANRAGDITGLGNFRIEVLDSAVYSEEVLLSSLTTTPSATLTLVAANGEMPTIDGQNIRGTGFDVRMDNVIIDGFLLTNFEAVRYANGIQIDGNSNLEVRNCTIDAQADFAILIGFRYGGDEVGMPSDDVWIHNNVLLNAIEEGTDASNRGNLIQILRGPDGTRIENNVFYAYARNAIFFLDEPAALVAQNTDIRNNIFYPTSAGSTAINVADTDAQPETTSDYNVFCLSGCVVSNTGFWNVTQTSLVSWQAASVQDANSIDADPLFRIVGSDFHLQSTNGVWNGTDFSELSPADSPAIDAGDPSFPFNSEPFPNGGVINIGAYGNTPEASLSPGLVAAVTIDIKPGSDPNCFNNDGHGVIPVAILSRVDFDATQVDPLTVGLDGQEVRVVGKKGNVQSHAEDVNGDGLDDLVVQITDEDGTYETGDAIATLTGATFDGTPFEGTDSICIVP